MNEEDNPPIEAAAAVGPAPAPNPDADDAAGAAAVSTVNSRSSGGKDTNSSPPSSKKRHGVKNKSTKMTSVSKHRPRTHEQREALKKPGITPSMFAFLSLPPGRPKKTNNTSAATANSNQAPSKPAPAPAPVLQK